MSILKILKMIFVLLFLTTVVFVDNIVGDLLSPCKNSDDCGKIIGRIIDSDTNEIVKEEFTVSIFPFVKDIKQKSCDYYSVKTKNGQFSINVNPGIYTISFIPNSSKTKYPFNFNPYHPPSDDQIIKVENGKITEIRKNVSEGGYLKLIIVNTNDQKVNFRDYFEKGTVNVWVSNDDKGYGKQAIFQKEELEAGEKTIKNLVPGVYRIHSYFPESGYGVSNEIFIYIERKKISEYRVVIDTSDNTGIHGFVRDINGAPLKGVEILICQDIENYGIKGFADTISNDVGYYKIFGIEEGIYMLRVESDFKDFYLHNIKITGNQLLSKDIIIDFPTN